MPMYINTNVSSLEAQRSLSSSQSALGTSFQRLSSGMRINSAADDAAGLAIAEQMSADIRSYSMAERNTLNAVSMAQTAEGALGHVGSILTRLRELAVQSSNGDLTATDRGYLDTEFQAMKDEITRIVDSSKFNGKDLLSGPATPIEFQVGIDNTASDRLTVDFGNVSLASLGLATSDVAGATATTSQASIDSVDAAINLVSGRRADFGAALNRMQTTVANLQSMRTNLSAAHSRIRDVDVAEESSKMARTQVLTQAATTVLAQANQSPQLALQLLKG
ncbi:MAG: flagellin FliC [Polyangiaceae bacterium]|nr:flagellin FliC [Polyangiaceae bacterium]